MFPHPPPGFRTELKRACPTPHLPHAALPALREAVAEYYNRRAPDFTSADHVLVGVSQRSVLFLLHLVVATCNQVAVDGHPLFALRVDDEATNGRTDETRLDLHVATAAFPQTPDACAAHVHATPQRVLVGEVTPRFTGGTWSAAVVVFPRVARRSLQTALTAVRGVLGDVLHETGALPTLPVQRATLLACSPWMLAYEARCRRLATVATEAALVALQSVGLTGRRADATDAFDPTYAAAVELENEAVSTTALVALEAAGGAHATVAGTDRVRLVLDGLVDGPQALRHVAPTAETAEAVAAWTPDDGFRTGHLQRIHDVLGSVFLQTKKTEVAA